jgi:diaminohydroxyphosphoribosylaminopyrimidine deaminase / 5-amino-6-(5-phosphoribosylamino)uracil reductase
MSNTFFMQTALTIAERGAGMVSPNPKVGAVLVHKNRIIGQGWHQVYGGPHAEVNAIQSVAEKDSALISKSTLYVTLEPCHHFGKTPPCVDLVLEHRIKHVVIAQQDPNPLTAGKSIEKLRAAKVKVEVGLCETEARWLNRAFNYTMETGKPYVILKWAQTKDGVMGLRDKRLLITGALTQRLVHRWRSECDAILVGKGTALADNPRLDLRLATIEKPYLRIAWCAALALPKNAHLLDDSLSTWFLKSGADHSNWKQTKHLPDVQSIGDLFSALMAHKKAMLLVEGGYETLNRFLEAGAWNEIIRITGQPDEKYRPDKTVLAPMLPPSANRRSTLPLGSDLVEFYVNEQV